MQNKGVNVGFQSDAPSVGPLHRPLRWRAPNSVKERPSPWKMRGKPSPKPQRYASSPLKATLLLSSPPCPSPALICSFLPFLVSLVSRLSSSFCLSPEFVRAGENTGYSSLGALRTSVTLDGREGQDNSALQLRVTRKPWIWCPARQLWGCMQLCWPREGKPSFFCIN